MENGRQLHLSHSHLMEADVETLVEANGNSDLLGYLSDGGIVLHVDFYGDDQRPLTLANAVQKLRDEGYTAELLDLVRHAGNQGAGTLLLDADGPVCDELPIGDYEPSVPTFVL
jgi:hypothetical protein